MSQSFCRIQYITSIGLTCPKHNPFAYDFQFTVFCLLSDFHFIYFYPYDSNQFQEVHHHHRRRRRRRRHRLYFTEDLLKFVYLLINFNGGVSLISVPTTLLHFKLNFWFLRSVQTNI